MDERYLQEILAEHYGIENPSLEFLREGGARREEILSFPYWVAIRHFQLQATILEIYGVDSIDEGFIDGQLYWLNRWQEAMPEFTDGL